MGLSLIYSQIRCRDMWRKKSNFYENIFGMGSYNNFLTSLFTAVFCVRHAESGAQSYH